MNIISLIGSNLTVLISLMVKMRVNINLVMILRDNMGINDNECVYDNQLSIF